MVAAFAPAHPQLRELWEATIDDVRPAVTHRRQPWVGTAMFVLGCLLSGVGVGAMGANWQASSSLGALTHAR